MIDVLLAHFLNRRTYPLAGLGRFEISYLQKL